MEIDRSTTWTRARKDKDGNFTKAVEKIVTKIGGSAALRKDLDLNEGPRKKLKLTGDCVDEVEEEDHAVGKTTQLGEEMVKENNQEVEKSVTVVDEQLEGVPVQTGTKDCGLFMMRYMKEICEDKDLNFASKWLRRKNLAYNVSDINEIKVEWANFFMKHHARKVLEGKNLLVVGA
ncbi:hypothetical protein ACET3Z_013453 [Daucus carota]